MANVRVFGYSGIVQLEKRLQKQFSSDSAMMRQEPYLWSVKLVLNGATPVDMPAQANDKAEVIFVEVDDGSAVRFEINPPGYARVPGTNSPKMRGENPFQWFKGGTISFVDAASV